MMTDERLSKRAVRRAGETLAREIDDDASVRAALEIVSVWRSIHQDPLDRVSDGLRRLTEDISGAFVVSRLKRTDTIIGKLRRPNNNFKLDKMCDIMGCRVIVNSIEDVAEVRRRIYSSNVFSGIDKCKDYIASPKSNGYRSLHIILKVDAPESGFQNLTCEVQVRTSLQHAWATALETYDVISSNALKFDGGGCEERRFFADASAAFAIMEGTAPVPGASMSMDGLKGNLLQIESRLKIVQRLRAASGAVTVVAEDREFVRGAYCLLLIDYEQQSIVLQLYDESEAAKANEDYSMLEEKNRSDRSLYPMRDVLLTKVSSLKNLREGYPNYLSDISPFLAKLNNLFG